MAVLLELSLGRKRVACTESRTCPRPPLTCKMWSEGNDNIFCTEIHKEFVFIKEHYD